MRPKNQARIRRKKIQLQKLIAEKETSTTALAEKVGHDISVVSKAINHGRFPRVIAKIEEALGA